MNSDKETPRDRAVWGEHVVFMRQEADGHQGGALPRLRSSARRGLAVSPCLAHGGASFRLGGIVHGPHLIMSEGRTV